MAGSESPTARTEQIIAQFLLKSLHVILSSRIPNPNPNPRPSPSYRHPRKSDRWFNLALGDSPPPLLDPVPPYRSPLDPIHLDLLLSPHDSLLERWSLSLDPSSSSSSLKSPSSTVTPEAKTYKKTLLLLRSIYSLLRLLPAHRASRMLLSPNHTCNFSLTYTLSSFAEPLPSSSDMDTFSFSPVDTPLGQLSASVSYRSSLDAFRLESSPLLPPRIISDYVGSPAADPSRAFPSSISFPASFDRPPPALTRPHSWTSPPLAHCPIGTSPMDHPHPHHLIYRTMSLGGGKRGEECSGLYPPFSTSPTPSPPCANSPLRSRLQGEKPSSPVSIPAGGRNNSVVQRMSSTSSDAATRSFLPPPSPRGGGGRVESQQESPSSFRKIEGLPSSSPNYVPTKGIKDAREESGRFSGILSSSNSPRVGFSRSSSRLSFTDDLDNCEFSCPFAVDDIDTPDSQSRNPDGKDGPESLQTYLSTRKSQGAAVGVLVHMLRNAPPLRQDGCSSQSSRSEYGGDVGSSSFLSRKTSDALEELRSYKEMKELLLSQSGSKFLDSMNQRS